MNKTIEQSFKDRIYVGMLTSICESMENLTEEKNFNLKKAINLHNKYAKLTKKTYGDVSRSEKDIESWSLAFSHAYEPSSTLLTFMILSELQKNQTLQNKMEENK